MLKFVSAILLLSLFFASCSNARKNESEKLVNSFYKALKTEDTVALKKIYPSFEKLGGYMKSSKIEVRSIEELSSEEIEVTIKNSFTNIKQKKFTQIIKFICSENPKNKKEFIIKDSYGLYDYLKTREYLFAKNTGFLKNSKIMSDIETALVLEKSGKLLELLLNQKVEMLKKQVQITSWSWDYGYVETQAFGKGTVVNNSTYNLRTLKYKLSFVADDETITKIDDGYLSYAELKPNASNDFTTMTAEIGNATKAYIQILFDTDEMLELVYKEKYNGTEYKLIN